MRKSLLMGGAIVVIAIVITAIVLSGFFGQEEELVLSNYPKLFEKEVVIVIGENATQIEKESAEAIAANLENLTGNRPKILTIGTESFKYSYNLIILGTPKTNPLLEEIYEMTDAIRVTEEDPGKSAGILEILRNPWNESKVLLLAVGSDNGGIEYLTERLVHPLSLKGLKYKNIIVDRKYPLP